MSLSYFDTAGLATQIAYVLISVTAILFPFRKKQIYEASPAAKYKIGGFPVLSIAGILALIFNLFIAYIFIDGPLLGFLSFYNSIVDRVRNRHIRGMLCSLLDRVRNQEVPEHRPVAVVRGDSSGRTSKIQQFLGIRVKVPVEIFLGKV